MTQAVEIQIPPNNVAKIGEIAQQTKQSADFLKAEYIKVYTSPYVQKDPSFTSDAERHFYTMLHVLNNFATRQPLEKMAIVPIGYSEVFQKDDGRYNLDIYALLMSNPRKVTRITISKDSLMQVNFTLFSKYSIDIGKYYNSEDYFGDERTSFSDPELVPLQPSQIIEQLGLKRVKINELATNLSKTNKTSTGEYSDRTDWRVVDGMITRKITGTRDNGSKYAGYVIADETILNQPAVNALGQANNVGLSIWLAPELAIFNKDDMCTFLGPISTNKQGRVQMNAYNVLPVHIGGRPT